MKSSILILALALLFFGGAEAKYSPGLEIAENENITLDGGYLIGAEGLPVVTVGTSPNCDYVVDGTADEVQLNAAVASNRAIVLEPGVTFYTADVWNVTGVQNIYITGYGSKIEASGTKALEVCNIFNYHIEGLYINNSHKTEGDVGVHIWRTLEGFTNAFCHNRIEQFDTSLLVGKDNISTLLNGAWGINLIQNNQIGSYNQIGCSYGVYVQFGTVHLVDNYIMGWEDTGVYFVRGDSSRIKDNIIISVTNLFGGAYPQYGIRAESGDWGVIVDLKIEGNSIENVNETAISINTGTGGVSFQNIIADNEINGYRTAIKLNGWNFNNIVDGNTIESDRRGDYTNANVIEVGGTWRHISVIDNTIDDVYKYGISTDGTGDGATIQGNHLMTETSDIVIYNTQNNVSIIGNVLTSTTGGNKIVSSGNKCSVIGNVGAAGGIVVSGTGSEAAHNT